MQCTNVARIPKEVPLTEYPIEQVFTTLIHNQLSMLKESPFTSIQFTKTFDKGDTLLTFTTEIPKELLKEKVVWS